jgi:hypothetical protein
MRSASPARSCRAATEAGCPASPCSRPRPGSPGRSLDLPSSQRDRSSVSTAGSSRRASSRFSGGDCQESARTAFRAERCVPCTFLRE